MNKVERLVAVFVVGLLTIKIASCLHARSLRDKLVFKNDAQAVADSLSQMNLLLPKLPKHHNKNTVTNYEIKDNDLIVNDWVIKTDHSILDTSFTLQQQDRFSKLAFYLASNYITGCGQFGSNKNSWFYDYRIGDGASFAGLRYLIVGSRETDGFSNDRIQFIDSAKGIYLLRLHRPDE